VNNFNKKWQISRRDFLKASSATLAALAAHGILPAKALADLRGSSNLIRFGAVTDTHYADKASTPSRFFREALDKLTECINLMNTESLEFLVELGDFHDGTWGQPATSIEDLQAIEAVYQQFNGPAYHVIGNHDLAISRTQFLANAPNPAGIDPNVTYYSYNHNGIHFVVLDPNYTDYVIPQEELDWLEQDLQDANCPAIIFIHQMLETSSGIAGLYVANHAEVRDILEESGKVLAVFAGHYHTGSYVKINNIHYYTLKGAIEGTGEENNAYAIVEVDENYNITVSGYRKAVTMDMPKDDPDMPKLWIDGATGGNGTGSTIFTDDYTTHDSLISVGFGYENFDAPYVSEAYRLYEAERDWSRDGYEVLSMWCKGSSRNTEDQLYVRLEDADGYSATQVIADTNVVKSSDWNQLVFDLKNFVSVDISRVRKVTIGIGRQNPVASGYGCIYLDQILVGNATCGEPLDGDVNGDCRVNHNDLKVMAEQWLSEGTGFQSNINNNGSSENKVDFKDFASMAKRWLKSNMQPDE